jgi:hypothetical protein
MRANLHPQPLLSPFEPVFAAQQSEIPLSFQEEFLRSPEDPFRVILEGKMHRIWHRPRWLGPVFRVLGRLGILVPYTGQDIPTTLRVEPGRDEDGRPYHVCRRTFYFPSVVQFTTTTIYEQGRVVDVVGPGNLLHIASHARFHPPATFTQRTARVAIRVGPLRWQLPGWLWPWLLGVVRFVQTADATEAHTLHVRLAVRHPLLGDVFGYEGTFHTRRIAA